MTAHDNPSHTHPTEGEIGAAIDAAEALAGPVSGGLEMDIASMLEADPDDEVPNESTLSTYDFHRPHTVSRAFRQNMQSVAETFAKTTAIEFTSLMRMNADISHQGIHQCSYGEFLEGLPRSTCATMVNLPPLKGSALLQVDLGLCFALMKKLLGGVPEPELHVRDFTEIERAIASDLMGRFTSVLRKSLSKLVEVQAETTGMENNPHYLSGIGIGESVIVLDFSFGLEGATGVMNLVFPLSAFGPVRDVFDPSEAHEDRDPSELQEDRTRVMDTLKDMSSEVVVELASNRVSLEKILNLDVGDVLDLGQPVDTPLKVRVQGREAWLGSPGKVGNRHAVRLISPWTKE